MEDPFGLIFPSRSLSAATPRLRPAPPPPSFPARGSVSVALQRTLADRMRATVESFMQKRA